MNVGRPHGSTRIVVFPNKLRRRGGGEDDEDLGKAIVPVKQVTTVEGRV